MCSSSLPLVSPPFVLPPPLCFFLCFALFVNRLFICWFVRLFFWLFLARRQIAKIWLQKAPGQDLAENGPFPMLPEVNFNSRPDGAKWPKSCSKRLLARIWPKTVRSQCFQKSILIAGRTAPNGPNLAPKGSWPGFGPKRSVPNASRSQF